MDSEDGKLFVKNLAYFVRTHEKALANALHLQRHKTKVLKDQSQTGTSSNASTTSTSSPITTLAGALSRPYLSLPSQPPKPAKLSLTPHHLFYLLSKFEDLGVNVGPMTVRLESIHAPSTPGNYVSFLGHAPRSRGKQSDADSMRSVSSIRSVLSGMSSVWSSLAMSNGTAKAEKLQAQYRDDLKYLYSCFTKIPALRLAPDHRARLISGFEEFPFDTAVPLFAFKNLSALEICDLDFRQFHGWDILAEQLRSLTVRRANVEDPIDLLQNIVLDDGERRRRRSSKALMSTTAMTPLSSSGLPWPSGSPRSKHNELSRSLSHPVPPLVDQRRASLSGPLLLARGGSTDATKRMSAPARQSSNSPPRPATSRVSSMHKSQLSRSSTPKLRRSSGSSGSSVYEGTPRHSTSDLLALGILPPSKWRFLRHLSLAENSLTHLTASSLVPIADTLQSLDLSGNLFTEIPEALASLTNLRALNLSNCMLDSLQSLGRNPLPAITVLNLRANRLLSLAGIERLLSLERLDLRDNRLHDPTELARLTGIPDMVDLYVTRNPFTRTHNDYRITIFNLFRATPGRVHDVTIDSLSPTNSEKKSLADRAPEPTSRPVIRLPPEDELASFVCAPSPVTVVLEQIDETAAESNTSRVVSESVLIPTARRKKAPRKRVVELSLAERLSGQSLEEQTLDSRDRPITPRTPTTDSEQPSTPVTNTDSLPVPSHHLEQLTRDPHAHQATALAPRPTLASAFSSPTPPPKIRDSFSSDDENPDLRYLEDLESADADLYRQKIVSLKSELGPDWLAVLKDEQQHPNASSLPKLSSQHSQGLSPPSPRTTPLRTDSVNTVGFSQSSD